MSINLPIPIREYFAAANAGDIERTVALFAEKAIVIERDQIARLEIH